MTYRIYWGIRHYSIIRLCVYKAVFFWRILRFFVIRLYGISYIIIPQNGKEWSFGPTMSPLCTNTARCHTNTVWYYTSTGIGTPQRLYVVFCALGPGRECGVGRPVVAGVDAPQKSMVDWRSSGTTTGLAIVSW